MKWLLIVALFFIVTSAEEAEKDAETQSLIGKKTGIRTIAKFFRSTDLTNYHFTVKALRSSANCDPDMCAFQCLLVPGAYGGTCTQSGFCVCLDQNGRPFWILW